MPNAVTDFVEDAISRLEHPDLVTVIPSHLFNPEKYYYYQKTTFYRCEPLMDREVVHK